MYRMIQYRYDNQWFWYSWTWYTGWYHQWNYYPFYWSRFKL